MTMKRSEIASASFLNAAGVFVYVVFVALLLSNGERIFGPGKSFVIPVFMMLLLVVSATITAALVLGRPVLLYVNGHKKEAVTLFFATLGWLVVFLAAVAAVMILR